MYFIAKSSSDPTFRSYGLHSDYGYHHGTSRNTLVPPLFDLLSVRTIGCNGEQYCGGESVSQSLLKDKAFSTFLDQNPPFELRPEKSRAD